MGMRVRSNGLTKAGLILLALGVGVVLLGDRIPQDPAWLQHLDLGLILLATVVYLAGRIQMIVGRE